MKPNPTFRTQSYFSIIKLWAILLQSLFFSTPFFAQSYTNETFKSGAFIIDMGASPQTKSNALMPYGMIYDLMRNYHIPVKWIIHPSKVKDGVDFTYNGVNYSGGPFIIPAEYRTTEVNARINYWTTTNGVKGVTTTTAITVPVYTTLTSAPRWTLDDQNGQIAEAYLLNAGIPTSAYDWQAPAKLGGCHDLFVMPHAEPTWTEHSNLLTWNSKYKGNIWAACRAASNLEELSNPANPSQKMNFLSTPQLVNFNSHAKPTPPYDYYYHTDAYMQFLGKFDNAVINGSEQVYLPILSGSWRPTTSIAVVDPNHTDIPRLSKGKAAILAYGKAFGDNNRGSVMYLAGHNHDKNGAMSDRIAAQRSFLNFSFATANERAILPKIIVSSSMGDTIQAGATTALSVSLPNGYSLSDYTIRWISSSGGTLSNSTAVNTAFTPLSTTTTTTTLITVLLTDACGRVFSNTIAITVLCNLQISSHQLSFNICQNEPAPTLSVTAFGSPTLSYQWQSSVNNTLFSNISGQTSATYTPSVSTIGTMYYRVIVTGACNALTSSSYTVVVKTPASIKTSATPVCAGGTLMINSIPTIIGGNYNWFFLGGGFTTTTQNLMRPNATTNMSGSYIVTYIAPNGCTDKDTVDVTIFDTPSVSLVGDTVICSGNMSTLKANVKGGLSSSNYQWQQNISGSWFNIGTNSPTYITPTLVSDKEYRVLVSQVGNGCNNSSNSFNVTVGSAIVPTLKVNNAIVCKGGDATLKATVLGGVGRLSYQWQSSKNLSLWSNIAGATDTFFIASTDSVGTLNYRIMVSSTGLGCSSVLSTSTGVQVLGDTRILVHPIAISECLGGTKSLSVDASGSAYLLYQWQSSKDSISWADIAGQTQPSFTPRSDSIYSQFYRVNITTSYSGCDTVTSIPAKVTVFADPKVLISVTKTAICEGDNIVLNAHINDPSNSCLIQWQSNNSSSAWINIDGATGTNYSVKALNATTKYRVSLNCSESGCCN